MHLSSSLSCYIFGGSFPLSVIFFGFKSELFLDSLILSEGEESLFQCDCQVQFLLACVSFVKHALIKLKSNAPVLEWDVGKLFTGK